MYLRIKAVFYESRLRKVFFLKKKKEKGKKESPEKKKGKGESL